jgi:hypothetical protein
MNGAVCSSKLYKELFFYETPMEVCMYFLGAALYMRMYVLQSSYVGCDSQGQGAGAEMPEGRTDLYPAITPSESLLAIYKTSYML